MDSEKPPVIFLMGPTASGKTDLAIELRARLPVDLISVDSALVYRGMDIGTAKPSPEVLSEHPHALIDIRDPSQSYSAADFQREAVACIESAHQRGRIPLLVGGTMLYFKALRDGLADMPPTDLALREQLYLRAEKEGWPALHAELAQVDPTTAERIHPHHSVRIERALQVFAATGKPLSAMHAAQETSAFTKQYHVQQFAMMPRDRSLLHERIERRLNHMLQSGFVEEVKQLHQRGDLSVELPSIRAVGYRQLWSFLEGEVTLEEAGQLSLFATRKLAKRQQTWLRGWSDLNLLYTQDNEGATLNVAVLADTLLQQAKLHLN